MFKANLIFLAPLLSMWQFLNLKKNFSISSDLGEKEISTTYLVVLILKSSQKLAFSKLPHFQFTLEHFQELSYKQTFKNFPTSILSLLE